MRAGLAEKHGGPTRVRRASGECENVRAAYGQGKKVQSPMSVATVLLTEPVPPRM